MAENLKKHYLIYLILFVSLNILNTFVVTTQALNRHVVPFNFTIGGTFNSILGNFTVIVFFMIILSFIIKKPKTRIITLLVTTFFLNFILFWSYIFNRYYGTSFSIHALAMFQNPAEGFGLSIAFEAFKEMITYYRIILFIPTIVLSIYMTKLLKNNINSLTLPTISLNRQLSRILLLGMLAITNLSIFSKGAINSNIIESSMSTYATQNIGIYQYYFLELLGFDQKGYYEPNNYDEILETLNEFNKNKEKYTNKINNQDYTYSVSKKDIANIDGALIDNLSDNDSITGILKDYNLVLVHLESFNNFLLKSEYTKAHLPNLLSLLEESYVFNNFYTNVGLGNSFDAEIAVLTGLNSNGASTLAWSFDKELVDKNYEFQTLPKLFNNDGYITTSMHGNTKLFYNRQTVHPDMFGIENQFFREEFVAELGYEKEDYEDALLEMSELVNHNAGYWVSDRLVFKKLNEMIDAYQLDGQKFMNYVITMLPHTPYLYDPYVLETEASPMYEPALLEKLDKQTVRYINYLKHYDEIFRIMFEDINDYGSNYEYDEANLYNRKKTAYLFYGDHGSGLSNGDIKHLLDQDISPINERKELLQTMAFLYVPGDNITESNFREGLLKGEQDLVRGQTDLFRTVIDLFDLNVSNKDFIYGTHGMSMEPTYSIDNRTGDVITDKAIFSLRNSFEHLLLDEEYDLEMVQELKENIIRFKLASDTAINKNLYREFREDDNIQLKLSYRTKRINDKYH